MSAGSPFHRQCAAFAVVAALLTPFAAARADQNGAYPALFGTREVRSANIAMFNKWTGMIARQKEERTEGPCPIRRGSRCSVEEWRDLLDGIRGKDRFAQIEAVNTFMNRAPYVTDPVNWGVPDYWATPLQFLVKDGDCEDYAIAKFVSLQRLGFTNAELRIVVLEDTNLKAAHAVLVVYHDRRAWILDNQIQQVVPADRIRHYRPVYSINEEGWWLHRP